MRGKLYGVGVGPGDKELVTVKALRILREADVIMAPKMKSGETTAYNIVEEYIKEKEVIECVMPMSKDFEALSRNYEALADQIEEQLKDGKSAAFITLGDPTVYSTYMQLNEIIGKRGYETEIIPGVTSFCAAAARLNMPLCERNEPLLILPASYEQSKESLHFPGTKVLMKANRGILNTRDMLIEEGLIDHAVMVECCGMENEKIYYDMRELKEKSSYFSLVIVKE